MLQRLCVCVRLIGQCQASLMTSLVETFSHHMYKNILYEYVYIYMDIGKVSAFCASLWGSHTAE